jgi:hypothetical protein
MIEYPCWFCSCECEGKTHYFSWEFDTPICLDCYNKLKNDPNFANNGEGNIIRDEFKIGTKVGMRNEI